MGPKVNRPEVDKVEEIVNEAIGAGAEVLAGGHRMTEGEFARGYWFERPCFGFTATEHR